MAFELCSTTKTSRAYVKDLPDGSRQGFITCSAGQMNHESVPGSGEYDTLSDCRMDRVNRPDLNGYEMVHNGYHYRVQTEPATDSQRHQGTIGFGGRQGEVWLYFRLNSLCYLHDDAVTRLRSWPDYSNPVDVRNTTEPISLGGHVPGECTRLSQLKWQLWPDIEAVWTFKPHKVIEKIYVSQAARESLSPALTPKDRTYLGNLFEIELPDSLTMDRQGEVINFLIDNGEGVCGMPLDFCFVRGKGGEKPLHKHFLSKDGKDYLFSGVSLEDLDKLLPGDLVFDPQMTQEVITDTNNDCFESNGSNDRTPGYGGTIFIGQGSVDYWGGWLITPDVPANASFTGGGSEYATLRIYRHDYGLTANTNIITTADDVANAAAWADGTGTERPTGSGFTPTTANTTQTLTTDIAQGAQWPDIDIAAQMEEVCALAWSANNNMRFRVGPDGAGNGYFGVGDVDSDVNSARVDAFYTAAAGGANPKGPLGMPLHGPFGGPVG